MARRDPLLVAMAHGLVALLRLEQEHEAADEIEACARVSEVEAEDEEER